MKSIIFSLTCLALAVGLTSCPKIVDQVPIPNRGPASLSGQLIFLDEFQRDTLLASTITGIEIIASNATGTYPATFDPATSTYKFPSLAPGTYSISYKADGVVSITNPRVEFAGGTPDTLKQAYLFPASTTVVNALSTVAEIKTDSQTILFPLLVAANTPFKVNGPFKKDSGRGANVVTVTVQPDPTRTLPYYTILSTTEDTQVYFDSTIKTITKTVKVGVVLDSANRPSSTVRAAQLYFSDQPNPGPTNYKMLESTNRLTATSSFNFTYSLAKLKEAGIIPSDTSANVTLYVSAYGLSGTMAWYGVRQDPEVPSRVIIPALNVNPAAIRTSSTPLPRIRN